MPPANMFVSIQVNAKRYFKKTSTWKFRFQKKKKNQIGYKVQISTNPIFTKMLINVVSLHMIIGAQAFCYEKALPPAMFSSLIWMVVTYVHSFEINLLSCILMTCVVFFVYIILQ